MELIDVLRHKHPPRTEFYLDVPTRYGNLRLDILGPVESALQSGGGEGAEEADRLITRGKAEAEDGNVVGAEVSLLDVVHAFPFHGPAYAALAEFYEGLGNTAEAEFHLKQLIALDPSYRSLLRLGKFLGRNGRYAEAAVVQKHLWETRSEAANETARGAALDYLVTLSRIQQGADMIEVATEAMRLYGSDTRMVYQLILAHILDDQLPKATILLNRVIPMLEVSDPMYGRFKQLRDFIVQKLPGSP